MRIENEFPGDLYMATAVTELMTTTLTESTDRKPQAGAQEFARLYRSHLRPVYAYVVWRVGHRETAEDITAQVFEKAWRSQTAYDRRKGAYATWLMSIARNTVTDHLRQSSRLPRTKAADAINPETHESQHEEDPAPDPLFSVISAERRQQLGVAIRGLEEREREILSLKFGAGLTNRQISSLLEVSESNTGTILYRALEKLRDRLEGVIKDEN